MTELRSNDNTNLNKSFEFQIITPLMLFYSFDKKTANKY